LATLLASGTPRWLDAGRVTAQDHAGRPAPRHFLNMMALGLPADVAVAVQRRGKRLGGTLTYLVEALVALARARPRRMALTVDGIAEAPADYHLVVVANTRTFGGGIAVAPAADPTDGALDLVTVGPLARRALLTLLARAYRGGHIGRPWPSRLGSGFDF
jgi:diacylglycerol kinase (ATP)